MDGNTLPPSFPDWQARASALGLKRRGAELVGPCPACGGTDRFAVADKDGRAVFNCRGCEGFAEILEAAGFADDRPERVNGARPMPDKVHEYRHPVTGETYHRVFRRGSGPGKEVWQDRGHKGRFYPFRVEDLPDLGERHIIIVEGEKCADHLAKRGYLALAWCGGADAVTRTRWDVIAGYPVTLWPDADASGKGSATMARLAGILEGLGCKILVVQIPPGKPDKWDAAEAEDGEIDRLLDGAIEFVPYIGGDEGRIAGGMDGMPMADLLNMDTSAPAWLWDGVLPTGGLSLLAGKPKTGKSTTARSLALAVARGDSALGKSTRQGAVFYAAFEERPASVQEHFRTMGATGSDPIECFVDRRPADPSEALDALGQVIQRLRPVLVVLDPIFRFLDIRDENAYGEVTRAMDPLLAIARDCDAHILAVHHAKKAPGVDFGDDVLGSTALFGTVDCLMIVSRDRDGTRTFATQQRYGEDMAGTVLALDPTTQRIEFGGTIAEAKARELEADILDTIASHGAAMKKGEVEQAVEGKAVRIRACLDLMCRDGKLTSRKEGRSILYEIADDNP